MAKQIIHTDKAPGTLAGYSQGVKANGFVFVAGQVPSDARFQALLRKMKWQE